MSNKKKIFMFPMVSLEDGMITRIPYIYNLCNNISNNFEIVNYGNSIKSNIKDILKYFFKADIFYFNWIEMYLTSNRIHLFMFVFILLKIAGKKIVWVHHDMHPHNDNSELPKTLMKFLARYSDYILIHTTESYKILNYTASNPRVIYFFHPFLKDEICIKPDISEKKYDLLIWGTFRKSKGVEEFLQFLKDNNKLDKYRIKFIGKFKENADYLEIKTKYSGKYISIDNEYIDSDCLDELHKQSKFIFFPYTGTSVLNSGALVSSFPKGTPIIAPNTGAFKQVAELGLINTYDTFEEVLNYIDSDEKIIYPEKEILKFREEHLWENFSEFLKIKLA